MKNIEKYQSLLETGEVDALLLTSVYNRLYAAQYRVAEGVAVVTREGAYYFTDSRYIEAAEKNLKGFTVRMTHPGSSEIERINEVIGEHTIKKLGFEENDMTYGDYLRYNEALHAVLVPMQAKIDAFRATKEPWEIELMRKAQAITDQTFSELCKIIQAGMTEKELEAELLYRLYKHGAEGPSFDPIVVSGPNTSLPHGVPGERKLEFGDFITMDFGCIYGGYCSDMTRTVALGFVSEEMDKVYKTVLKAQLAGIAATKAGVAGRDIDGAARKVIADAGYGDYFGHGYGHSLGILIHEAPNANTRNDQPMPAGAVVSAEPGIYLPGKFGVRIEDVTVITETGCEVLTKSPKKLIIL
ncbi:MAG: aminopeptidase P family protein [Oscillospiraceae bacterium]